ncbi:MAG: polyhydroxyalkanoic acid system family protein [Parvularculaceae bacterium]
MPREVTVTLSHDLGEEEARRRLREGFGKLQTSFSGGMMPLSFSENWASDSQLQFTAKGLGQNIFGTVDIFPNHVRIQAMLPGMLASLAEIITGKLEKEGTLLLEKK